MKQLKENFAQETFHISIQHALFKFMNENDISNDELAKRMKMDPVQVDDIFNHDMNMDLRTLGKIFNVLGCVCKFKLSAT